MAYYRFNPSGLDVGEVCDRMKTLWAHCKTWGVNIQAVKMTAQVVWVQTNIDIPNAKFQNRQEELGFDCAKSNNEPTTA